MSDSQYASNALGSTMLPPARVGGVHARGDIENARRKFYHVWTATDVPPESQDWWVEEVSARQ
jgi:hypothetical protein